MNAELSEKIAKLPDLSKAQLLPIWAENFKTPPPPRLRKELMVPILAYRMQEREYGGLGLLENSAQLLGFLSFSSNGAEFKRSEQDACSMDNFMTTHQLFP